MNSFEKRKRDLMRGNIRLSTLTSVATALQKVPTPVAASPAPTTTSASTVAPLKRGELPSHTVLVLDLPSWCRMTLSTIQALADPVRGNLLIIPDFVLHQFDESKAAIRKQLENLRPSRPPAGQSNQSSNSRNNMAAEEEPSPLVSIAAQVLGLAPKPSPAHPSPTASQVFLTPAQRMEMAKLREQLFTLKTFQTLLVKIASHLDVVRGKTASMSQRVVAAGGQQNEASPTIDESSSHSSFVAFEPKKMRPSEAALLSLNRMRRDSITRGVRMQQRRGVEVPLGDGSEGKTVVVAEYDAVYASRSCISNRDTRQIIACALYYLRQHVLETDDVVDQGLLLRHQVPDVRGQFFRRCVLVTSSEDLRDYANQWNRNRAQYDEMRTSLTLECETLEVILGLEAGKVVGGKKRPRDGCNDTIDVSSDDAIIREEGEAGENNDDDVDASWLFEDSLGVTLPPSVADDDTPQGEEGSELDGDS